MHGEDASKSPDASKESLSPSMARVSHVHPIPNASKAHSVPPTAHRMTSSLLCVKPAAPSAAPCGPSRSEIQERSFVPWVAK